MSYVMTLVALVLIGFVVSWFLTVELQRTAQTKRITTMCTIWISVYGFVTMCVGAVIIAENMLGVWQ
jgi:Co/Zn/Cd efflux system component